MRSPGTCRCHRSTAGRTLRMHTGRGTQLKAVPHRTGDLPGSHCWSLRRVWTSLHKLAPRPPVLSSSGSRERSVWSSSGKMIVFSVRTHKQTSAQEHSGASRHRVQLGRNEMKHFTATRIISPPASDDIPTGEREPHGHDAREKDTIFRRRKKQNKIFSSLPRPSARACIATDNTRYMHECLLSPNPHLAQAGTYLPLASLHERTPDLPSLQVAPRKAMLALAPAPR
jgi:hypothetical protein